MVAFLWEPVQLGIWIKGIQTEALLHFPVRSGSKFAEFQTLWGCFHCYRCLYARTGFWKWAKSQYNGVLYPGIFWRHHFKNLSRQIISKLVDGTNWCHAFLYWVRISSWMYFGVDWSLAAFLHPCPCPRHEAALMCIVLTKECAGLPIFARLSSLDISQVCCSINQTLCRFAALSFWTANNEAKL